MTSDAFHLATCPKCGRTLSRVHGTQNATGQCRVHGYQAVRWLGSDRPATPHEWIVLPKPPRRRR